MSISEDSRHNGIEWIYGEGKVFVFCNSSEDWRLWLPYFYEKRLIQILTYFIKLSLLCTYSLLEMPGVTEWVKY